MQFLRPTLMQIAALVVLLPVVFFTVGAAGLVSFLAGAACGVIPQAYFALRLAMAARRSAARAARQGLAAEGGKFLLSAALFAWVFAVAKPAMPGLVFLGYGALWVVQLIGSVLLLRERASP
jgi:F0F1-type ATP synthase assembly protein I